MSGFNFFANFFSAIDRAVNSFVTAINGNVNGFIIPLVSIGVSIMFSLFALYTMLGEHDAPINDFLKKVVTIACVSGIAGTGGLYQSDILQLVLHLPEDMATALVTGNATASNILDACAGTGFGKAGEAINKFDWMDAKSIGFVFAGICMFACTLILVGVGGMFIMTAKVVVAILAAVGPMFIFAYIWSPLRNFFNMWVNQVALYSILTVLFSAVFGFFMNIFNSYINNADITTGTDNIWFTVGGICLLTAFAWRVTKTLPQLSAGLAQGVFATATRNSSSGSNNTNNSGGSSGGRSGGGNSNTGSDPSYGGFMNRPSGSGLGDSIFRGKNAA